VLSLADELGEVFSPDRRKSFVSGLRDSECRSPDSGISLVHSPERAKSSSPQQIGNEFIIMKLLIHIIAVATYHRDETLIIRLSYLCADTPTPASSCSSGLPLSQLELLEATHRGLYKFVPRHRDEMEVDIGDPIYVQKEAEDCWCEGNTYTRLLFAPDGNVVAITISQSYCIILTGFSLFRGQPSHRNSRRVSVRVRGRRRVHGFRFGDAQGEARTVSFGVHGFGGDNVAQGQFRAVSSHTEDHRTSELQTTIVHT